MHTSLAQAGTLWTTTPLVPSWHNLVILELMGIVVQSIFRAPKHLQGCFALLHVVSL